MNDIYLNVLLGIIGLNFGLILILIRRVKHYFYEFKVLYEELSDDLQYVLNNLDDFYYNLEEKLRNLSAKTHKIELLLKFKKGEVKKQKKKS